MEEVQTNTVEQQYSSQEWNSIFGRFRLMFNSKLDFEIQTPSLHLLYATPKHHFYFVDKCRLCVTGRW